MHQAKEIVNLSNDWITGILMLIIFILVINMFLNKEKFSGLYTLFYSNKYLKVNYKSKKNSVFNSFQILFFFVQFLTFSLFLYLLGDYFYENNYYSEHNIFLFALILTTFYFIIKYTFQFFLFFVLGLKPLFDKLIIEQTSFLNALSLWLIPVLCFLIFSSLDQNLLIIIAISYLALLLTIRYLLILFYNKTIILDNLFYFFLYLCALEIAPLFIIVKLTI